MKAKRGFVAGNFDVIHPGYIAMFKECKSACDQMVILLQTDPTVERPEKLKPIFSVEERTELLLSLIYIDEIITYTYEHELYDTIKNGGFDVRFLGDDYKDRGYTGDDLDIRVHYLDRSHGWSTTKYKKMIAASFEGKNI
jgi:glycerol-3-phosphate cytidylyltransferase